MDTNTHLSRQRALTAPRALEREMTDGFPVEERGSNASLVGDTQRTLVRRLRAHLEGAGIEAHKEISDLYGSLYAPFRGMKPGLRPSAWVAFLRSEGLRVEDLDSRLEDDVVRGLACALVDAGLKQVDVAAVVGKDQQQVSRWYSAHARSSGSGGKMTLGTAVRCRSTRAKSSKDVAAEVLAEAKAATRVPESGLILAESQLELLPVYLSEYQEGLASGAPVGPGVDIRLRRIHREAVRFLSAVQDCAQQRGILL